MTYFYRADGGGGGEAGLLSPLDPLVVVLFSSVMFFVDSIITKKENFNFEVSTSSQYTCDALNLMITQKNSQRKVSLKSKTVLVRSNISPNALIIKIARTINGGTVPQYNRFQEVTHRFTFRFPWRLAC